MNAPLQHQIVNEALRDNAEAIELVARFGAIIHTWDDLVDRDHALDDNTISSAFTQALVDLPRNTFYRQHFDLLNATVVTLITNWRIANELERNADPKPDASCDAAIADLHIAFIIRSTYIDFVVMCAQIIGGMEWAVACGVHLRRWAHGEGFAQYVENLAIEKAAREAASAPPAAPTKKSSKSSSTA